MHAINSSYIKKRAKEKGFTGIKPLLQHLGLHRNTLDRYLSGAPVLPSSIEAVLQALEIPIEKALTKKEAIERNSGIDSLVRSIHRRFPDISIFLFGSRARGNHKKYSDYDLGI